MPKLKMNTQVYEDLMENDTFAGDSMPAIFKKLGQQGYSKRDQKHFATLFIIQGTNEGWLLEYLGWI